MNAAPILELQGLSKRYEDSTILHNLNCAINNREITAFLGPSGCGKSTLLRLIAGFEKPDSGLIRFQGKTVSTSERSLSPEQRGIGMVFQDYALFPHMTVAENLAFGLNGKSAAKKDRIAFLLRLMGIADLGQRMPHQLSGGQQQRVAIARSLAPSPKILLLDECFSNCDPHTRERIRAELRPIFKREEVSVVFVTHDREEAFDFSDRVAVMKDGALLQMGTPQELYCKPNSCWLAEFLGQANFIWRQCADGALNENWNQNFAEGGKACQHPGKQRADMHCFMVRPEDITLRTAAGEQHDGCIVGRRFLGEKTRVKILLNCNDELQVYMNSDDARHLPESVCVNAKRWQAFPADECHDCPYT